MARIALGGYKFVLAEGTGIERVDIPRLSPAQRQIGVQRRQDDTRVNKLSFEAFPLGVGYSSMHRETGHGVGGLLDSIANTIHHMVYPGGLAETQTHANPADHFKKAVNFLGDLWGIFEEDVSGTADLLVARKFGASSDGWAGGGTILTSTGVQDVPRGYDLVVHKSAMFVIASTEDEIYNILSSANGVTWSDAGGTGFPDTDTTHDYITAAISVRNKFDDDMGRLITFGNVLLVAIWRHPDSSAGDGLIEVLSTTDSGT